jgi:hypothetical protein
MTFVAARPATLLLNTARESISDRYCVQKGTHDAPECRHSLPQLVVPGPQDAVIGKRVPAYAQAPRYTDARILR